MPQASDASRRGGSSVKNLTLAAKVKAKPATHAVVTETLKHLPLLRLLVADADLLQPEAAPPPPKRARRSKEAAAAEEMRQPPTADAHTLVLVFELLFGGGLRSDDDASARVVEHEAALRSALARRLASAGASSPTELLDARVTSASASLSRRPRWVRANTLLCTAEAAASELSSFSPIRHPFLPDLLRLPPGSRLHAHPAVVAGRVVLQGLGSSLAAHALAPRPGTRVVDACAAPGNKTTHLAALMRGRGVLTAFDADAGRSRTLAAALRLTHAASIASCVIADFLRTDTSLSGVLGQAHAVLLDPSCSGSGTSLSRGDALLPSASEQSVDTARLGSLCRFQAAALRHALRAASASRVAYSTCSVHVVENEGVVASVMTESGAADGWRLERALPQWHRRGVASPDGLSEADAAKCIRVDPLLDEADGFFLALFVRDVPANVQSAADAAYEASIAPAVRAAASGRRAQEKAAARRARPVRWAGGAGGQSKGGKRGRPLFV